MTKKGLPYLLKETTRHGRTVFYVRRGIGSRVRILGSYGSHEFMAAYNAALAGVVVSPNAMKWAYKKSNFAPQKIPPKDPQKVFRKGYVYFIGSLSMAHIKIGFATDVFKRLAELQTGHPEKLVIFHVERGTMEKEAKLHARFSNLRAYGEWFRHKGRLREYIKTHRRDEGALGALPMRYHDAIKTKNAL